MNQDKATPLHMKPRGKPKGGYYVDFTEYRPAGTGQSLRASADGVRIDAVQVTRVLGVEQVREMARVLMRAADEAEKRGCPPHLMET